MSLSYLQCQLLIFSKTLALVLADLKKIGTSLKPKVIVLEGPCGTTQPKRGQKFPEAPSALCICYVFHKQRVKQGARNVAQW